MATCSPSDLLESSACFACLGLKEQGAITISLLCQILQQSNPDAECDPQALVTSSKCFSCLTPHQMQMVIAQLLCEIYSAEGTGGTGGIVCGAVDPVDAPTGSCAIYYNTTSGGLWCWNNTTSTWVKYIA